MFVLLLILRLHSHVIWTPGPWPQVWHIQSQALSPSLETWQPLSPNPDPVLCGPASRGLASSTSWGSPVGFFPPSKKFCKTLEPCPSCSPKQPVPLGTLQVTLDTWDNHPRNVCLHSSPASTSSPGNPNPLWPAPAAGDRQGCPPGGW